MKVARWWKIVIATALAVIAAQMLSRPPANLLSLRASRYEMLDAVWPRSINMFRYPSWSIGSIEPDTRLAEIVEGCGRTSSLTRLSDRVGTLLSALREKAQSMYRSDIIALAADAMPWWRVKLWHVAFGLGLWDGKVDEPSAYLATDQIDAARARSDSWYERETRQVICGASLAEAPSERDNPSSRLRAPTLESGAATRE